MSDKSCCCHKKYRSDEEKKKLIHRLNRIEGQIRGLRGMLEDDAVLYGYSGPVIRSFCGTDCV